MNVKELVIKEMKLELMLADIEFLLSKEADLYSMAMERDQLEFLLDVVVAEYDRVALEVQRLG
jgi:hypothetical protein